MIGKFKRCKPTISNPTKGDARFQGTSARFHTLSRAGRLRNRSRCALAIGEAGCGGGSCVGASKRRDTGWHRHRTPAQHGRLLAARQFQNAEQLYHVARCAMQARSQSSQQVTQVLFTQVFNTRVAKWNMFFNPELVK